MSDSTEIKCVICLETLSENTAKPDICNHEFCLPCLEKWSRHQNFCPVDRKPFKKIVATGKVVQVKRMKRKRKRNSGPLYDVTSRCEVCNDDGPGELLLCDSCDLAYHGACLQPQLWTVPEGNWYCPPCEAVARKIAGGNVQTKEIDDIVMRHTNLTKPPAEIVMVSSIGSVRQKDDQQSDEAVQNNNHIESRKRAKGVDSKFDSNDDAFNELLQQRSASRDTDRTRHASHKQPEIICIENGNAAATKYSLRVKKSTRPSSARNLERRETVIQSPQEWIDDNSESSNSSFKDVFSHSSLSTLTADMRNSPSFYSETEDEYRHPCATTTNSNNQKDQEAEMLAKLEHFHQSMQELPFLKNGFFGHSKNPKTKPSNPSSTPEDSCIEEDIVPNDSCAARENFICDSTISEVVEEVDDDLCIIHEDIVVIPVSDSENEPSSSNHLVDDHFAHSSSSVHDPLETANVIHESYAESIPENCVQESPVSRCKPSTSQQEQVSPVELSVLMHQISDVFSQTLQMLQTYQETQREQTSLLQNMQNSLNKYAAEHARQAAEQAKQAAAQTEMLKCLYNKLNSLTNFKQERK